jgi:predicted ATP pyrophosphatase (TIGR00289 family)
MEKVAVLFSGGKDSTYAAYLALKQNLPVKYLVSVFSENKESYMWHFSNIEMTKVQAQLMGLEHVVVKTKGEKEKEMDELGNALAGLGVDGLVSGAVASEYQKTRVDGMCDQLGIKSIAPLWHKDPEKLLREEFSLGFETIFTSVSAYGLDEAWLGRRIDEKCIAELKKLHAHYGVSLVGEGGEYCTLVLDCPLFVKRIVLNEAKKVWHGDRGSYAIKAFDLVAKV